MSRRQHLSDDRLIEMCLAASGGNGGRVAASSDPHLLTCETCEARRALLASTLDDLSTQAIQEADAHFPAERLARQQARILQQIERLGRTARVIAFPAGHHQESARPSLRRRPRWIAAAGAVAAAFIVGIFAEHLVHELPGSRPDTRLAVRTVDSGPAIRAVVGSMSDDELLGQIEQAVGSAGPAALRPLDVLTPRAWDVR